MNNLETYKNIFKKTFMLDTDAICDDFTMSDHEIWDSVGHMSLVSYLEDAFGITLEAKDIIEFDSFRKGIDILRKYGIEI